MTARKTAISDVFTQRENDGRFEHRALICNQYSVALRQFPFSLISASLAADTLIKLSSLSFYLSCKSARQSRTSRSCIYGRVCRKTLVFATTLRPPRTERLTFSSSDFQPSARWQFTHSRRVCSLPQNFFLATRERPLKRILNDPKILLSSTPRLKCLSAPKQIHGKVKLFKLETARRINFIIQRC